MMGKGRGCAAAVRYTSYVADYSGVGVTSETTVQCAYRNTNSERDSQQQCPLPHVFKEDTQKQI